MALAYTAQGAGLRSEGSLGRPKVHSPQPDHLDHRPAPNALILDVKHKQRE